MSIDFKISGRKREMARIIGTASNFCAADTGSAAYLKCILITADEDTITMTGASEFNAIRVEEPSGGKIKVEQPGTVMIQAHWLRTALTVVQEDHLVEITYDGEQRKLIMKSFGLADKKGSGKGATKGADTDEPDDESVEHLGNQHIELSLPKIDAKAMRPTVGEADTENGIAFAPNLFASTYYSASVARDVKNNRPSVSGVLANPDMNDKRFRMMSMDARLQTAMDSFEYDETIGEGAGAFLLHDGSTRMAMEYLLEGDRVEMHSDDNNQMHMFVRNSDGSLRYHIRVATINQPVEKFPEAKMHKSLKAFIPMATMKVSVEKAELMRILSSAATVGSLDATGIGGQSKNILIRIHDGEVKASVLTSAVYDESVEADIEAYDGSDEYDVQFILKYGLHGHILDAYHDEKDPKNVSFLVIDNPKDPGVPYALIMVKDEPLVDDKLAEYIALFGVSKV